MILIVSLTETNTLLGPVSELMIRSRLLFHGLFVYLIALFIYSLFK